jgi:hypothetical protein
MPEEATANQTMPSKGSKLSKYKWWIVGGLAILAVLVFYFVQRSNSNALGSTGSTTSVPGGTGTQIGIPGPPGPEGPTGPKGARGKRGKRGKKGTKTAVTGPPTRQTTVGSPVTHIASRTAARQAPVAAHNSRIQRP